MRESGLKRRLRPLLLQLRVRSRRPERSERREKKKFWQHKMRPSRRQRLRRTLPGKLHKPKRKRNRKLLKQQRLLRLRPNTSLNSTGFKLSKKRTTSSMLRA
jgi:hypothetical protein